ncbi:hypothetical protein GGGNBK_06650 [Sporosarcina sp. ANT_H38]
MLYFKGNGRNVHVQTKGVYVWYVIYFTSLPYHKIIIASRIHNEFHMIVTLVISSIFHTLYLYSNMLSKKISSTYLIRQMRFLTKYIQFFERSDSSSFNFSSKTRHASSIGAALVMSTPAFFSTSIG